LSVYVAQIYEDLSSGVFFGVLARIEPTTWGLTVPCSDQLGWFKFYIIPDDRHLETHLASFDLVLNGADSERKRCRCVVGAEKFMDETKASEACHWSIHTGLALDEYSGRVHDCTMLISVEIEMLPRRQTNRVRGGKSLGKRNRNSEGKHKKTQVE